MSWSLIGLLGLAAGVAAHDAKTIYDTSKTVARNYSDQGAYTVKDVSAWRNAALTVSSDEIDRMRVTVPCMDELFVKHPKAVDHLIDCLASGKVRLLGGRPKANASDGLLSFSERWGDTLREIRWANQMDGQTGASKIAPLPFESPNMAARLNKMLAETKGRTEPKYADAVVFENYRYKLMYLLFHQSALENKDGFSYAARVYFRQGEKWVVVDENHGYSHDLNIANIGYVTTEQFKRNFYSITPTSDRTPLKRSKVFWSYDEEDMMALREFEANGGGLKN